MTDDTEISTIIISILSHNRKYDITHDRRHKISTIIICWIPHQGKYVITHDRRSLHPIVSMSSAKIRYNTWQTNQIRNHDPTFNISQTKVWRCRVLRVNVLSLLAHLWGSWLGNAAWRNLIPLNRFTAQAAKHPTRGNILGSFNCWIIATTRTMETSNLLTLQLHDLARTSYNARASTRLHHFEK